MIDPFANNHQSMQIGELTIENQTDKIIIYGDIDLYLNDVGYEQAKKLHELTSRIIESFKKSDKNTQSDERLESSNERSIEDIDNPFCNCLILL